MRSSPDQHKASSRYTHPRAQVGSSNIQLPLSPANINLCVRPLSCLGWQITGFYPNGTFTGTCNLEWEALQAGGPAVNIGLILQSSNQSSWLPTSFTVNGEKCRVVTRAK